MMLRIFEDGRGGSLLVVQWVNRLLQALIDEHYIYTPIDTEHINITRFKTNLLLKFEPFNK